MKQIKSLCVYCLAWFNLFFLNGCIKEKIEVSKPKTESLTMQLHNQNASGNLILDGTAPDIYYFQQNENGTYTFSLSSSSKLNNLDRKFGPDSLGFDWTRYYQVFKLDENGALIHQFGASFPGSYEDRYSFDGIGGDYFLNGDVPNRYTADDLTITYPVSGSRLFESVYLDHSIDPFIWPSDPSPGVAGFLPVSIIKNGYTVTEWVHGLTRTSDGIFLINKVDPVSSIFAYSKFYHQDNRVYKVLDPGFVAPATITDDESESFSAYVSNKGDDAYFINVSPSDATVYSHGVFINDEDVTFAPGAASSVIDLLDAEICFPNYYTVANRKVVTKSDFDYDLEIRFGGDNHQLANVYAEDFFSFGVNKYRGIVEVPFEVWDATKNIQLKAGFVDANANGKFEIKGYDDPTYKTEWIIITDYVDASSGRGYDGTQAFILDIRCGDPLDPVAGDKAYMIYPTLKPGLTWDSTSIPETTIAIKKYKGGGWRTRLIKVNESGVTEVKRDFLRGNLRNINKVVPFNNGYALLFNSAPTGEIVPPAEISLIDENFNQYQDHIIGLPGESEHKMVVSGNTVYYAAGPKGLRLVAIRDGQKIEKELDFLGQDKILKESAYNLTPTKSGGIAILAWVRPTVNTRDLLFMEFDENLNLVKKSN
jgi:hypothetical protein